MHFEFLVEDLSGATLTDILAVKILGRNGDMHTYRIHPYRGIGRLPQGLGGSTDPRKRILLDRLPKLLSGYGNSLQPGQSVVLLVDSDRKSCTVFKRELVAVVKRCKPAPQVLLRIAIEEMEAWLLGDRNAITAAYPRLKKSVLDAYQQDAICGTWEKLADAIHPGGSKALQSLPYSEIGRLKSEWALKIGPHMDVWKNASNSFMAFRDGLLRMAQKDG